MEAGVSIKQIAQITVNIKNSQIQRRGGGTGDREACTLS